MTWSKKITLFYIIVVYFGSKTLQCICCTVRNLLGDNFQYLPSAVNQHKVVSSIENDFHYMIHTDCILKGFKSPARIQDSLPKLWGEEFELWFWLKVKRLKGNLIMLKKWKVSFLTWKGVWNSKVKRSDSEFRNENETKEFWGKREKKNLSQNLTKT